MKLFPDLSALQMSSLILEDLPDLCVLNALFYFHQRADPNLTFWLNDVEKILVQENLSSARDDDVLHLKLTPGLKSSP